MKRKKRFLTLLMACVVVVFFCLAGIAIAGPGPNPGGEKDDKVIGPNLKGVIIAGWLDIDEDGFGTVEVFLSVGDQLYTGIIIHDNPDWKFLNTLPIDITKWSLPARLVTDYNMGEGTLAVVYDEKDVSNLLVIPNVKLDAKTSDDDELSYEHVLYCEVKITFLVVPK